MTKLRVSSPAELIAALPFVIGFHPADSLAVAAVRGRHVVFAARSDLPELDAPPEMAEAQILVLVSAVVKQDVESAVVIGYGDECRVPPAVKRASEILVKAGLVIIDQLRVENGRYWSLMCGDKSCCSPEGRPCQPPDGVVAAEATFAGAVALPDRAAFAAQVDPVTGEEREAMTAATARAMVRLRNLAAAASEAAERTGLPAWSRPAPEPPGSSETAPEPPGSSETAPGPPGSSETAPEPPGSPEVASEPLESSAAASGPPGSSGATTEPPASSGAAAGPPGSSGAAPEQSTSAGVAGESSESAPAAADSPDAARAASEKPEQVPAGPDTPDFARTILSLAAPTPGESAAEFQTLGFSAGEFLSLSTNMMFLRRMRRAGREAVREAERRYRSGGRLSDDEVAWLGLLLVYRPVREYAWTRTGDDDWELALWSDVTRRVDPVYAPAPASLLAFVAWRTGSGVLASVAVDRALNEQEDHSLALLVHTILVTSTHPRALDGWPVITDPPDAYEAPRPGPAPATDQDQPPTAPNAGTTGESEQGGSSAEPQHHPEATERPPRPPTRKARRKKSRRTSRRRI